MFRDSKQRWLVIKTLLGLIGLSAWVLGDENQGPDGVDFDFAWDDPDMHRAYDDTLKPPEGYSSRETYLRLAFSLNTNRIAVPLFASVNALDYENRAFLMGLLVSMFGDGEIVGLPPRSRIDDWLAENGHLRGRTEQVQAGPGA